MCGIVGCSGDSPDAVRSAVRLIAYRGPDGEGVSSDGLVTLGHARLSIIDVDPRSAQPMEDATGQLRITFNGEIYNYREIRGQLESRYPFRTESDTEVILAAYREWGTALTEHLHGMFAFVIEDCDAQKVFLFRDRAGIKPLYYSIRDGRIFFASEVKGVLQVLAKEKLAPSLDRSAIELYIALGYVPAPRTLYEHVLMLEPGHILEFDLKVKQMIQNVQASFISNQVQSREAFKGLLERSILSHLVSDVPVGVFFSGGTDSSLIAAILQAHGKYLRTYSVRFPNDQRDENYFRAINEHLKLDCTVIDFGSAELEQVLERVLCRIDEPVFDSSIFPTFFLAERASHDVKVVLSGEGGDELFRGYHRHIPLSGMSVLDSKTGALDRLFLSTSRGSWMQRFVIVCMKMIRRPVSFYLSQLSPAGSLCPISSWNAAKVYLAGTGVRPIDFDFIAYLENDLLRKIDLATSYASIEGRVPLLDQDVIASASEFESEHLKGGVLKSFLKRILADYLPTELVYRKKAGFGLSGNWFQTTPALREATRASIQFLDERKLLPVTMQLYGAERIMTEYPSLAYALLFLGRAIMNGERFLRE